MDRKFGIKMAIYFYGREEAYGCFSNFAYFGFWLDNKWWKTSEHYFQAKKFQGTQFEEDIRNLDNPMDAAEKGRDRKLPLRKDWELVKDDIMKKAVLAKFLQNSEIKKILLDTQDEILIEKTKTDYYWGCGDEKTGKNMLGLILMEVRNTLR